MFCIYLFVLKILDYFVIAGAKIRSLFIPELLRCFMKISTAVTLGIVSIIAIAVIATIGGGLDQSNQSKIRVAFFPSIGHAVPIVGIENGIFEKGIGEQIKIETKLFDSGPQVIESIFASSIDVAYVGPGPVINGFLKS